MVGRSPGTRIALVAFLVPSVSAAVPAQSPETQPHVPENLYRGELVSFPGPWAFEIGRSSIILVSDRQLEDLADPDKVLDLSLTVDKYEASLRQVCEGARAAGHRTLIIAFDHFFSQYRPGQHVPRRLVPDTDEYVQRIAAVSRFAQQYGLGLELSVLSPLEVGPAYERQTGESGFWLHYRKGLRDPKTGTFSVELWQQRKWANNKGVVEIADAGVRAFAFREAVLHGTPYRVVDPRGIVEVTDVARVEILGEADGGKVRRIRVFGQGRTEIGPLDRVCVIQQYRTPELDYFSDKALPFLRGLLDRYADAGVKLNGLYADEMHIQQNWVYHGQHDHGQFALRYVSPGLARRYASLYGSEFADFAKYMIYFVYGQEDFARDLTATHGVMHVFGPSPEDVRRTALFRSRYYRLLQDGVVELFAQAKRYAERRMGHRLEARAHATWAESPTCDAWRSGRQSMNGSGYEYTPSFIWSNTVQQAASACHDYFKWGDFLTGNGNDHTEGGYADRNYYALALACSTGILNDVPYSYCAHWGMPYELSRRRASLVNTYGAAGSPAYGMVQDMQHRDVDVLMLYPLDLVAVEERFGSWMTLYGYANYVTQAKLIERGRVARGAIELAGRRFTTLVATFEPFPSRRLLGMMRDLAEAGGRVIWSGPPPVLSAEGDDILAEWKSLAGIEYAPEPTEGYMAPGRQVTFEGALKHLPPQMILTDFLVDHVYPVVPISGTETLARVKGSAVGTRRVLDGGGTVVFLGFRPRDDQARSLGYEARWWFEILHALGAYPPSGRFSGVNDNTEFLSRTTDYLVCRFPNGAVAVARHFRDIEEGWSGGFARDAKQDEEYLKRCPPPTEAIDLRGFKVNGHEVTFTGRQAMTFRVSPAGDLIAFAGAGCRHIVIDGRETVFADQNLPLVAWAPVHAERRVENGAVMQIMVHGAGVLRIPAAGLPPQVAVVAEGPSPGSRGEVVPCSVEGGTLIVPVKPGQSGRWLYVVPAKTS